MNNFINSVADNKILQALAIVASLIALMIFIYQATKRIIVYLLKWQDKSIDELHRQAKIAKDNTNYLISLYARHAVILFGFVAFYFLFNEMKSEVKSLENPDAGLVTLRWIFQVTQWVIGFLVGDRCASIMILARRTMAEFDGPKPK